MNIPRTRRLLVRSAAFAALALAVPFAASCASDGDSVGGGMQGPVGGYAAAGTTIEDANGSPLANIVSIDTAGLQAEGKVKFVIANASGADMDDLLYSVTFHFPPGKQLEEIQMTEEKETTSERPLTLYKNDRQKVIEATCPDFAGPTRVGKVRGTTLTIQNEPPVVVLPRSASGPGTTLFSNRLECTAIASSSELEAETPRLWVELENTDAQKRKASDLEVQVVFPNGGGRTKWKSMPAIAPGARVKVELDLKGVNLGDKEFRVKVRPQAL